MKQIHGHNKPNRNEPQKTRPLRPGGYFILKSRIAMGVVEGGRCVFTPGEQQRPIVRGDVELVRAGGVHCCNPADLALLSLFRGIAAWIPNGVMKLEQRLM
ncbi:hypothetical protein HBDW_39590 [Herbaspirillum sp. DW155]|uniref:hypothetical protein n=1 Tax=Herbaspirillum sp. DW155 TaxID=3095609 RepID=UPI00308F6853|nr:hypothetical protein HBDW_39590 [Herbaspirillum sp. DW155]